MIQPLHRVVDVVTKAAQSLQQRHGSGVMPSMRWGIERS